MQLSEVNPAQTAIDSPIYLFKAFQHNPLRPTIYSPRELLGAVEYWQLSLSSVAMKLWMPTINIKL